MIELIHRNQPNRNLRRLSLLATLSGTCVSSEPVSPSVRYASDLGFFFAPFSLISIVTDELCSGKSNHASNTPHTVHSYPYLCVVMHTAPLVSFACKAQNLSVSNPIRNDAITVRCTRRNIPIFTGRSYVPFVVVGR